MGEYRHGNNIPKPLPRKEYRRNPPPEKKTHPHVAKNISKTRPARISPKGPHHVMIYGKMPSPLRNPERPFFLGTKITAHTGPKHKRSTRNPKKNHGGGKQNTKNPHIDPSTPVPENTNLQKTNSTKLEPIPTKEKIHPEPNTNPGKYTQQ